MGYSKNQTKIILFTELIENKFNYISNDKNKQRLNEVIRDFTSEDRLMKQHDFFLTTKKASLSRCFSIKNNF